MGTDVSHGGAKLVRVAQPRHGVSLATPSYRLRYASLSQAVAGELDPLGIVDEAVEDCIGDGWAANHIVPAIDRNLAGEKD